MKKVFFVSALVALALSWASMSYSIRLDDLLKEVEPPKPPAKEAAPKTSNAPKPESPPSQEPETGGLIGLGESLGVVDKKTSNLLRQGSQVLQALQPIGYEEEKAIGGALATEVFSRFGGPYDNPQVQRYIMLVGQAVAQLSDRPNIPWHFSILNTEEPNAFAAPGGYVFVSRGLLRLTQNEAQLAGVLGHEIAHVSKKHALQTIQRSKTLQGVGALTLSLMDKDPAMFGKLIDEISGVLFTRGLDKDLEYEADQVGMEYAYRVGYYPGGLIDFIKTLAGATGSHSIFFSTHPSPNDRYARLKSLMSQYRGTDLNPVLSNRFKSETKGLL